MRFYSRFCLMLLIATMTHPSNRADEPEPQSAGFTANLKLPTLGGVQFWTDVRWWHGWRIQENKVMDQCRVLSPANVRHFAGSKAACEAKLSQIISDGQWPDPPEHVVVCLHGLMRTHRSFVGLGKRIEQESTAKVIHFGYASTRAPVSAHAESFRGLIEGLPGRPKIDLVGHSMGNIVARHAIADWQRDGDPEGVLDRLGRFVMQGPPNQGAQIAKRLQATGLFGIITGASGLQLGGSWDQLHEHLATPPCEFAIVAGAYNAARIRNPLVQGDSDLIVSVEESKLSGASDFTIVPVVHSFLMDDKNVQELTMRFLETGAFSADGQRNPLP